MADAKTLHALLELTTIDDHEEVLKTCNAALKQSKNDINLLHIRFVALLKLDRYDDALRVLEESGDKLKQKAKVERAYALYKLGELDEAKSIAKSVANDRGARHVEAQAVCSSRCTGATGNGLMYYVSHIARKTSPTPPYFTRT